MKRAPWSLRWAFAWAVLVGDTIAISYGNGTYRIDVRPARVRRWLKQNERKRQTAREAVEVDDE